MNGTVPLRFLLALAGVAVGCGAPVPPGGGKSAAAPSEVPGIGRPVIDWERGSNPPIRVVLGIGGVADRTGGGPFIAHLYPEPGMAETAHFLARTYAPFRAHLVQGEMVFQGRGPLRPGPVEQRMIVEWARRATASLAGGAESAYGLVLSWHRGASVGSCETVSVYLTGEVRAETCAWGGAPSVARLQPAALGRIYEWYDTLAAFQDSEPGIPGETEPARLVFAGRGLKRSTRGEARAIESLTASVLRELTIRRRDAAAAPAAAPVLLPQETVGSPGLPVAPLARLAPAVPPSPPPAPSGGEISASGRRSAVSQPLRLK